MSPLFLIIFLTLYPLSIVASASILDSDLPPINVHCNTTSDCQSLSFGIHSFCDGTLCSCDFGYIRDYWRTWQCTKFNCTTDANCTINFSDSRCDTNNSSCVCVTNYIVNPKIGNCMKDGCTEDADCIDTFTHCNTESKKCVCKDGYRYKMEGRYCQWVDTTWSIGTLLKIGGFILLGVFGLVLLGFVIRAVMRRCVQKSADPPERAIQLPNK